MNTMRALALAMIGFAGLASAQPLPDGSGKSLVETRCTGCHELSNVTRSAYTRAEWLDNVHKMRNVGARLSDAEMETVVDYLARAFPERPRPQAVVIPGDVKITIREWIVPKPGGTGSVGARWAQRATSLISARANVRPNRSSASGLARVTRNPSPRAAMRSAMVTICSVVLPRPRMTSG